jgi:hypothetical protein
VAKKKIIIPLCLILLWGCGSGVDTSDLTVPLEPTDPIMVKGGKDGINVIVSSDKRRVRYLGEVENQGLQPYCFIDITFSTLNASGAPIDQGQARVELNGVTLSIFNNEANTCLRPGQFGSFDTGEVNLTEDFSDRFDFRMCFKNNIVRCQNFPLAQDPVVQLIADGLTLVDSNGLGTFRGRIKNDSTETNFIPFDVKTHFTVLDAQGKVIDTAASVILTAESTAPTCSQLGINVSNGTVCLGPGVSTEEFTVNTDVPMAEIGTYYFRIYRSECIPNTSCSN